MRLRLLNLLLVVCAAFSTANAQTQKECGTADKQSWFNNLKTKQVKTNQRGGQLTLIPFQIHLFKASNGSANLTLAEIYAEIDGTLSGFMEK